LDSGIDEIKISVDGSTPEEFEKIRPPLKWAEVSENIQNLIKARDSLKSRTKIFITCCTGNSAVLLLNFPAQYALGPKHNWGGQLEGKPVVTKSKIREKLIKCQRLWRTFTILAGGTVAQCHADVHGEHSLGNIYQQTIEGVWNSLPYNILRARHEDSEQSKIELCRSCSQCRR
jgi:radical SAM protein with 4Fe4S-binding SPASM domain